MSILKDVLRSEKIHDPAEYLAGVLLASLFPDVNITYEKEKLQTSGGKILPDFTLEQESINAVKLILEVTKSSFAHNQSDPKSRQRARMNAFVADNPGYEAAVLYRENLVVPDAQLASMMTIGAVLQGELSTKEARIQLEEVALDYGPETPLSSLDVPWQDLAAQILGAFRH